MHISTINRRAVGAMVALAVVATSFSIILGAARAVTDNTGTIYRYFVAKGLTPNQSAGIVGNLMQESSTEVDPTYGRNTREIGKGIAQWTQGSDRWDGLVALARKQGSDVWSLQTQMDFMWQEFHGSEKRAFTKLLATRSVEDATLSVSANYERCGYCLNNQRIAYARTTLARHGGKAASTPSAPAQPSQAPKNPTVATKPRDGSGRVNYPYLVRGNKHRSVLTLQYVLTAHGYYVDKAGVFGPQTESQVRALQRDRHLPVTGRVDLATWRQLLTDIERGASGNIVRGLQAQLQANGYGTPISGVFDARTKSDVVTVQRQMGYNSVGFVGDLTWRALLG